MGRIIRIILLFFVVTTIKAEETETTAGTTVYTSSIQPEEQYESTRLNAENEITEAPLSSTPEAILRQDSSKKDEITDAPPSSSPDVILRQNSSKEDSTISSKSITEDLVQPYTVLEYQPITSFYHPNLVTLAQIIPPGKPWPASADEYTSNATKPPSPQTTFSPNLVDRFPELTQSFSSSTTVSTTDKSSTTTSHQADEEVTKTTTTTTASSVINIEYKPTRPFYRPNPVTLPQLIPPGKPWPDSPEGYQTTPKEEDVPSQSLSTSKTTIADQVSPQTILEYKPINSFHHPTPVTVAQIVPSGTPWPSSPEEKKNGSSSTTITATKSTLPPNLVDRFPELTSHITTKSTTAKPTPAQPSSTTLLTTTLKASSNHIVLEYKPQRPWYHPRPGNTIGQIVPPGKPWPASPAGYLSFSVTKPPAWLRQPVDENLLPRSESDNLERIKENLSLLEPNALQYYHPVKCTTSAPPFTSGAQKTTLSDILDILKEVHNITLTTNKTAPEPSHLLPFDGERKIQKEILIDPSVIQPPTQNYGNVIRPKEQQKTEVVSGVHVYDGTPLARDPAMKERIFPNPKYVSERKPHY